MIANNFQRIDYNSHQASVSHYEVRNKLCSSWLNIYGKRYPSDNILEKRINVISLNVGGGFIVKSN